MADSYGFLFTAGDDNRTVVDSEFTRMSTLYKGAYVANESSGASSLTLFPAAITTQEQPLVFIRPNSASGIIGMSNLEILGAPGGWTGFRVRRFNDYTIQPAGRWFVANFVTQPLATYGARFWSAAASPIFDSASPPAIFVRSSNTWTYTGSGQTGQGLSITYFSAPFNLEEDEYFMINNFVMSAIAGTSGVGTREIAAMWDYPARLLKIGLITNSGNTVATGLTVMVGKTIQ
ncbi:hypothetical protein C4J88_2897 [Pseudomonas sp. R4-39-08]|uniref:hypothetical protein n=1 Tax=Pseudomonas sp. R4-39-08 TaxID=1173288 RepID=UPI000F56CCF3|nr:hypothetical protein [Pseudomonas sp. R4-39-08]AZF37679.1 hypothetical protein C4J88_2897 [Pseudomonas sp. R4-39-08]